MEPQKIIQILAQRYNLKDVEITEGPRQFVAETFICLKNSVPQYFIKVIPKAEFPRKIIKSLPVLQELNEMKFSQIPEIVPTSNGELLVEESRFLFAVFGFIEGKQTFQYDNHKLGEFLAELHQVKITAPVEVEHFSSYVDELFLPAFHQSLKDSSDSIQEALRQTLLPYKDELLRDWQTFQKTIEECKQMSSQNFVLTHGDAPGNVIVHPNGNLFVIDWDDIMLAPRERDIWFLENNAEFIQGYTKNNLHFEIHKTYYRYYLLWRMFDDLLGWIGEIMSDKPDEHRKHNVEDLKNDYFNWLRPAVRDLP